MKMIFKFILLLSIVLVVVLIGHTEGYCPHHEFARKHICYDCDLRGAKKHANINSGFRPSPTGIETVFILPKTRVEWNEDGNICTTVNSVTCYEWKRTKAGGPYNQVKTGTGNAVHDTKKDGHYENGLQGHCVTSGNWTPVPPLDV